MVDIVEIPVTTEEDTVTIEDIKMEDCLEEVEKSCERETLCREKEAKPKPKPGRPVGAKSKIQGKPRAPRKVKINEEIQVVPLERPIKESKPIPTMSYDNTSAMMLSILQQQAQIRQSKKSDLWKSWFR